MPNGDKDPFIAHLPHSLEECRNLAEKDRERKIDDVIATIRAVVEEFMDDAVQPVSLAEAIAALWVVQQQLAAKLTERSP